MTNNTVGKFNDVSTEEWLYITVSFLIGKINELTHQYCAKSQYYKSEIYRIVQRILMFKKNLLPN